MDAELTTHRIEAFEIHGNTPVSVPLVTPVGNFKSGVLDQGGCRDGVSVDYDVIVSLYPGERYDAESAHTLLTVWMYDAAGQVPTAQIEALADFIAAQLEMGQRVLVHCQAGLNRSSLIVGTYLVRHEGMTGDEAVELIRSQRSPACLCNPDFEVFVRGLR